MMRGLWRKIWLETRFQFLLFAVALFIVPGLLTMLLPQLEEGLNQVFATLPFVRRFIQALLGEDLGRQINPQSLQAIIWVHPTVLALIWAQEIIFCTRVPPGEIDRGTIDILLSWPISRRKLFVAETLMWLVGGMMFCAMMLSGHFTIHVASVHGACQSLQHVRGRGRDGAPSLGLEQPPRSSDGREFRASAGIISIELPGTVLAHRGESGPAEHPALLPPSGDSGQRCRSLVQHRRALDDRVRRLDFGTRDFCSPEY
jgi:hypothetical protein